MTKKQIERAYNRLWKKVTFGDGYQPYGYDTPTMNITHPGFTPAVNRLKESYKKAE